MIVMTGVTRGLGRELSNILNEDHDIFAFVREPINFGSPLFKHDLSLTLSGDVLSSLDSALQNRELRAFIHCAGTLGLAKSADSQIFQNYDEAMQVNVLSAMRIIDICLPHMLSQRSETTPYLLNVSSGAALFPIQGLEAYCSSKAAALMAFQCLARRYSIDDLNVFSIAPGLVATDMLTEIMQLERKDLPEKSWFENQIAKGCQRDPEEAAQQLIRAIGSGPMRKNLHGKFLDFIDPENPVLR